MNPYSYVCKLLYPNEKPWSARPAAQYLVLKLAEAAYDPEGDDAYDTKRAPFDYVIRKLREINDCQLVYDLAEDFCDVRHRWTPPGAIGA